MAVEFAVRLNDDGTVTWFGLNLEDAEHARAVETVKTVMPGAEVVEPADPWETAPRGTVPTLEDQIREAQDLEDLAAVWKANKDVWTAEHNKLAAERKKVLGK